MAEVFFVAPLPPPVHGFSAISERMRDLLLASGRCSVRVSDMSPRSIGSPLSRWASFAVATTRSRRAQASVYLAFSGGLRQLVDLAFVAVARLRGFPLFVHHHSFAYLNVRPWHARLALRMMRPAVHIVLCGRMGDLLCTGYGIHPDQVRVLSNAAFVQDPQTPAAKLAGPSLVIGFLSNITAQKGVFDLFEVVSKAREAGLACTGVVAGPVDNSITQSFRTRLDAADSVRYVGAVYGESKEAFLSSMDVLLFPTLYRNEAEPVTIFEALSHGVLVVARDRGCIGGMIPRTAGRVISDDDLFVQEAVDLLGELTGSAEMLDSMRTEARESYLEDHQINTLALDKILAEIIGGPAERTGK